MSWIRERMAIGLRAMGAELTGPRAPWKAKSVWIAAVVAILGTGFWRQDSSALQSSQSAPQMADTAAVTAQPPSAEGGRSPSAAFRLGISYIGGFLLGWCYRRFVKFSLVITGGIVAALMALKRLGWFESDLTALQVQVQQGSAWLGAQAAALNYYLSGLIPSAGMAAFGAFRGFRRKRVKTDAEVTRTQG